MQGTNTDNFAFYSRESADKPSLSVTYSSTTASPTVTPTATKTPTPSATKTPTPTVSGGPTVSPTPTVTVTPGSRIIGLANGDTVSGKITVTYNQGSSTPTHVEFYLNNVKLNDDLTAPYVLGGEDGFDSSTKPDGTYTLRVVAYKPNAIDYTETLTFHIDNSNTGKPVAWNTDRVKLSADNFYMVVNGKKYYAQDSAISVHSDPGTPNYTTLELIWNEMNTPMRLFMYFKADTTKWWMNEIRTYNGQTPGDWIIMAPGNYFETSLGEVNTAAQADITNATPSQVIAKVHFGNLKLQAFLNQPSPTVLPSVSATLTPCDTREKGDANCDGKVDFIDFEIWRKENVGEETALDANFNYKDGDTKVDFIDFEIWRQGFTAEVPQPSETIVIDPSITCAAPVDCAAPPAGCQYAGGNRCSCGQLVCANDTVTPSVTEAACPQPTPCPSGFTQVQGDAPAGSSCPVYSCVAQ